MDTFSPSGQAGEPVTWVALPRFRAHPGWLHAFTTDEPGERYWLASSAVLGGIVLPSLAIYGARKDALNGEGAQVKSQALTPEAQLGRIIDHAKRHPLNDASWKDALAHMEQVHQRNPQAVTAEALKNAITSLFTHLQTLTADGPSVPRTQVFAQALLALRDDARLGARGCAQAVSDLIGLANAPQERTGDLPDRIQALRDSEDYANIAQSLAEKARDDAPEWVGTTLSGFAEEAAADVP